jgi:hypothetical protein
MNRYLEHSSLHLPVVAKYIGKPENIGSFLHTLQLLRAESRVEKGPDTKGYQNVL